MQGIVLENPVQRTPGEKEQGRPEYLKEVIVPGWETEHEQACVLRRTFIIISWTRLIIASFENQQIQETNKRQELTFGRFYPQERHSRPQAVRREQITSYPQCCLGGSLTNDSTRENGTGAVCDVERKPTPVGHFNFTCTKKSCA